MNYYQHHIGDYCKSTVHLTLLEHGVYRRLLDTYYDAESALSVNSDEIYRKICARTDEEKRATDTVLNEFFTKTDQGWQHDRCNAEIDTYREKSDKARNSARARWTDANAMRTHSERNAKAMPTQCEGNANQEPITNNQEPITINQEPESNEEDDFFSPAPVKRFRKPTMEEVEDYARLVGATRSDGQVMWDHWEAGGWKRGNQEIKCWKAAFRSWKRQGWLPSQKQAALDKPKIDWRNTL